MWGWGPWAAQRRRATGDEGDASVPTPLFSTPPLRVAWGEKNRIRTNNRIRTMASEEWFVPVGAGEEWMWGWGPWAQYISLKQI